MEKVRKAAQAATLEFVLGSGLIKEWSVAIDGGAHHGNWSRLMAEKFERVIAFEPADDNVAEFYRQKPSLKIEFHQQALMDRLGMVIVTQPPKRLSNMSRYCVPSEKGEVEAITVDSLGLPRLGLLKLDLEGAEYLALQGAAETIARCRPVIIVEIDNHGIRYGIEQEQTVGLIESMQYKIVYAARPDQVFVPWG